MIVVMIGISDNIDNNNNAIMIMTVNYDILGDSGRAVITMNVEINN